jgi:ROK family
LESAKMVALSLDMGGSHIGCGVVRDNELLGSASLDSELARSLESLLPCIADVLRTLLKDSGVTAEECDGIAIGFPGIVDVRNGRILSTLKKYEDAIHLDLGQWAMEQFGLSLRIENDARIALLGEQYAGAVRGMQDVVMITLGTGIGGAAMMLGKFGAGCPCPSRMPRRPLASELSGAQMRMWQRWVCRSGSLRLVIATDSAGDPGIRKIQPCQRSANQFSDTLRCSSNRRCSRQRNPAALFEHLGG